MVAVGVAGFMGAAGIADFNKVIGGDGAVGNGDFLWCGHAFLRGMAGHTCLWPDAAGIGTDFVGPPCGSGLWHCLFNCPVWLDHAGFCRPWRLGPPTRYYHRARWLGAGAGGWAGGKGNTIFVFDDAGGPAPGRCRTHPPYCVNPGIWAHSGLV